MSVSGLVVGSLVFCTSWGGAALSEDASNWLEQEEVLAPGIFKTELQDEESSVSLPGLYVRITQLNEALQQAQGRLEEALHRIHTLEKRIDQMVQNAQLAALADDFSKETKPALSLPKAAEPRTIQENILPSDAVIQSYEEALTLLRRGHVLQARTAFETFLTKNARHALCAQAAYWLGVTFYIQEDYSRAVDTLTQAYQHYPRSPKKTECLLKLAHALNKLDRKQEACSALKELLDAAPTIKSHKKSIEEVQAETARRQWGCLSP